MTDGSVQDVEVESPQSPPKKTRLEQARRPMLRLLGYRGTSFSLLFLVILFYVNWFTPIHPFATLKCDEECSLRCFSPDGSLLVTASKHNLGWRCDLGPLRVWNVIRGTELVSMAADWKEIEEVCFSPDGVLLAAHEKEGALVIWNVTTGEEIARFRPKTHSRQWVELRFSPDGRFLVFRDFSRGLPDQGYISFWNIEASRVQESIDSNIWSLAFAPDGLSFVTVRQDEAKGQEVLVGKMTSETPTLVKRYPISVKDVRVSPSLQLFATVDDSPGGEVGLWDMTTGAKRHSIRSEPDRCFQFISFAAGGRLLVVTSVVSEATTRDVHRRGERRNDDWQTTLWEVSSRPAKLGSLSEWPDISPDGSWFVTRLKNGATLVETSKMEITGDLVHDGDQPHPGHYIYLHDWMRKWPTSFFGSSRLVVGKLCP